MARLSIAEVSKSAEATANPAAAGTPVPTRRVADDEKDRENRAAGEGEAGTPAPTYRAISRNREMNGDLVISKQRRWACWEQVSWQIAGIRQDPRANEHRIPVEQEKETKLKGFYLLRELHEAPAKQQIEWARHPHFDEEAAAKREQTKDKQARLTESSTTEK